MVSGSAHETSDLGMSRSLVFYVVGVAVAIECIVVGLLGMAA